MKYERRKSKSVPSDWVCLDKLPNKSLSLHRDLKKDVPSYIDLDDFLKFRAYSHALKLASSKQVANPAISFINSVKNGGHSDLSDADFAKFNDRVKKKASLWGDARTLSVLKLCMASIDILDLSDDDDKTNYKEIHDFFKTLTGYSFNDVYIYMNGLSRKIMSNPGDISISDESSDRNEWSYSDWINLAIKDCWESSEGIDLLTLYSRVEASLPAERTDSFMNSYLIK